MLTINGASVYRILETRVMEVTQLLYRNIECAETIDRFDLVRLDGDKLRKANASSEATMPALGLAMDAGDAGDLVDVMERGLVTNPAWTLAPAGARVYASITPGEITTTPPSGSGNIVQRVGRVMASNQIYLDVSEEYVVV